MKAQHEGALTPPCVVQKKPAGSTHSSASGLSSREQLERQAEFHSSDKTRHDSPVPNLQGLGERSQKWRGSLWFLPPFEMRHSSIAPNPVESREAPSRKHSSRKPMRRLRHHEMRAFFSCMAWRAIPSPLSKLKRRLDSLEATQWASRDTCLDSRGERSPLLLLETSSDPLGETGMRHDSVFPSNEIGVLGKFWGGIKGSKYCFALQDGTWDFS